MGVFFLAILLFLKVSNQLRSKLVPRMPTEPVEIGNSGYIVSECTSGEVH